ncbi:hypothetical protein CRYUN_Cryun10bG0082900 [Craigia yunnanensis]
MDERVMSTRCLLLCSKWVEGATNEDGRIPSIWDTFTLAEPVSRHMEDQGLEFLQFSFHWFNYLLIREIPFHLVTCLWDTYLAEGDALPDFLVYIFASFLLTMSSALTSFVLM